MLTKKKNKKKTPLQKPIKKWEERKFGGSLLQDKDRGLKWNPFCLGQGQARQPARRQRGCAEPSQRPELPPASVQSGEYVMGAVAVFQLPLILASSLWAFYVVWVLWIFRPSAHLYSNVNKSSTFLLCHKHWLFALYKPMGCEAWGESGERNT